MNFTPEQITKAKAAKSAEELRTFAKENGLDLTEEEAKNYFEQWHKEGELADEELDNVSGGCGGDPEPKYQVGMRFYQNGCFPYVITKVFGYDSGWKAYFYELKSINGKEEVLKLREELIDNQFTLM